MSRRFPYVPIFVPVPVSSRSVIAAPLAIGERHSVATTPETSAPAIRTDTWTRFSRPCKRTIARPLAQDWPLPWPRRPDARIGKIPVRSASGGDLTTQEIERLADPAFVGATVTGPALSQTKTPPLADSHRDPLDTVSRSLSGNAAADGVASGSVAAPRDDGPVVLAAVVPATTLAQSESIDSKAEVDSSASSPSPPAVDHAFVF